MVEEFIVGHKYVYVGEEDDSFYSIVQKEFFDEPLTVSEIGSTDGYGTNVIFKEISSSGNWWYRLRDFKELDKDYKVKKKIKYTIWK